MPSFLTGNTLCDPSELPWRFFPCYGWCSLYWPTGHRSSLSSELWTCYLLLIPKAGWSHLPVIPTPFLIFGHVSCGQSCCDACAAWKCVCFVLLTLLLSLSRCIDSSLLSIYDLFVLYLYHGLSSHISFHRKYLLCLLYQLPFLNFSVNNRQQAEFVSLVFSTLVTPIFSKSGWRIHFPPRCLGFLGTVIIARKKKKKKRAGFFFPHTDFQLDVGFISHWGLSVQSEVVCYLWCLTRSCAYCIFYRRGYI